MSVRVSRIKVLFSIIVPFSSDSRASILDIRLPIESTEAPRHAIKIVETTPISHLSPDLSVMVKFEFNCAFGS